MALESMKEKKEAAESLIAKLDDEKVSWAQSNSLNLSAGIVVTEG